MNQYYTTESVTEGHPDKLCDLIADSVLDACLDHDMFSHVACEVMATKGNIIVAGEITSNYEPHIPSIVRSVLQKVGYDPARYAVQCFIHKQSPDIAAGVDCSLELRRGRTDGNPVLEMGAGDQGIMVGYACNETPQMLPLPVVLARRLTNRLTMVRKSGAVAGLLPDGKAQVTVEYDEDGKPLRLDTIVLSAQHNPEKPMDELFWQLTDSVLEPALLPLLPDKSTKILINPAGRFVLGGPEADTGLTGRKLMVDSYGVFAPHGGGAFSGKDPTKVDRSGAYMAQAAFYHRPRHIDDINGQNPMRPVPERETSFRVEQVVVLSDEQYRQFKENGFMDDQIFLFDYSDKMWLDPGSLCWHCVLVKGETSKDGVLVDAEGYSYARYAAFAPDCSRLRLRDAPVHYEYPAKAPEQKKNRKRKEPER